VTVLGAMLLLIGGAGDVDAVPADDAYVAGYASAILEREFRVSVPSLVVRDGVITLAAGDLGGADRPAVESTLGRIRGVRRVIVLSAPTPAAGASSAARAGATPEPAVPEAPGIEVLPAGLLFRPLIADPRWPAFGTTIRHYFDDSKWETVAAVSLGDMMPIVRGRIGESLQWEAGVHAALWGLFDMDSESADLINMDYIVGGFGSLRRGPWSGIARVFHRSAHLGDEEILHHHTTRVNFSYEGTDFRVAYEPLEWLRVYGGAGYIFRVEPKNYAPWSLALGGELRSTWTLPGRLRPIFGVDVQSREEHDWEPQVSVRAGLELESAAVLGRRISSSSNTSTGIRWTASSTRKKSSTSDSAFTSSSEVFENAHGEWYHCRDSHPGRHRPGGNEHAGLPVGTGR
jgi:hypothetical protein